MEKIRGVVDENIKAAEFFIGVGKQFVDVGFFGQVGGHTYCASAKICNLRHYFLGFLG